MGAVRAGKYRFNPDSLVGLRDTLRISQMEMAERLGVPADTVSSWETGYSVPDAHTLAAIYSEAMIHQVQPNFFQPPATTSPIEKPCTQCGGPRTYSYSSWCRTCQYDHKKAKAEMPQTQDRLNKPCTKCGGPRTYSYSSWCRTCQYDRKKERRAEVRARHS